ncbi:uncharacterized protein PAC_05407 [Phialocephala subalpina]|uniref:Uncharacterized protein n=1 Tax=Phialocephala subalpina TaxID=576137 RepID=A0A1L7WRX9_9HELO|nr:uncharacterized protein PAC_05407 [Phialocephala subalpina]
MLWSEYFVVISRLISRSLKHTATSTNTPYHRKQHIKLDLLKANVEVAETEIVRLEEEECADRNKECVRARKEEETAKQLYRNLLNDFKTKRDEMSALEKELQDTKTALSEANEEIWDREVDVSHLEATAEGFQNDLKAEQQAHKATKYKVTSLDREIEQREAHISSIEQQLAASNLELERLNGLEEKHKDNLDTERKRARDAEARAALSADFIKFKNDKKAEIIAKDARISASEGGEARVTAEKDADTSAPTGPRDLDKELDDLNKSDTENEETCNDATTTDDDDTDDENDDKKGEVRETIRIAQVPEVSTRKPVSPPVPSAAIGGPADRTAPNDQTPVGEGRVFNLEDLLDKLQPIKEQVKDQREQFKEAADSNGNGNGNANANGGSPGPPEEIYPRGFLQYP